MQHTLHLYIGEDLASIAEAVNRHLSQHCDDMGREFSHVITWLKDGSSSVVRQIDSGETKTKLSLKTEGKAYFEQKHNKIVVAHPEGKVSPFLYICIYIQLYDKAAIEELKKILEWLKSSTKPYIIDVYGLSEDLAFLFCTSESEKHDLVHKIDGLKKQADSSCNQLMLWKRDDLFRHFILMQNTNVSGLGLDMDKNTLIRIWGEYARLSTTNYSDLFPVSDIDRPDVMAFGISGYWFSQKFFHEYLFRSCLIRLFERESVNQHVTGNPLSLLNHLQSYINKHSSVLSKSLVKIKTKDNVEAMSEFDGIMTEMTNDFNQVIDRTDLSLPEKRAMIALFLGEDDELLDDSVLLKYLPTIDDCLTESLNLFIEENNKMIDEGKTGVLTTPKKGNHVYLPLEDLRKKRTLIRQSQSFIRKKSERLQEIEKSYKIIEESHKRLTEEGFVYGETTFKLNHDVVEKPLDETYTPHVESAKSVDLRKEFSTIRNQGRLGACTSFSMASIFEFILNQGDNSKKHCLSPRFLYYNVCKKNDDGTIIDNGSSFYSNIHSLGHDGICEENLCPYDDKFNTVPTEEAREDALTKLVTEAKNVKILHKDLTAALSEGYPIGISLKVYNSFGKNHKGFIFRPSDDELKSTDFGYHAMVICGYSEKDKVYIVRNSWGEAFGDKGYCYIPFSYIEDTKLCRQACIVTGVNCGELKGSVSEMPVFDIENKDVEYAVLRILIDEEKQNLKRLKSDYDECYRNYMKLMGELTNKGKRDSIMSHALSEIILEPTTTTQTVVETKIVPTNKLLFVVCCCVIAALCLFALPQEQKLVGTVLPLLISALLWWLYPSTKTVEETKTVSKKSDVVVDNDLDLKFLFAGKIIDEFDKLRNNMSNKLRYMQSYIRNLETWLEEEKCTLSQMDEKIKKPFYSLFSDMRAKEFISEYSNRYLEDMWLYKLFGDYNITDKGIVEFKKMLYDSLKLKISDASHGFSMCDYILNTSNYKYLPIINRDEVFRTITNMSVPFAQGVSEKKYKQIILCNVRAEEKKEWEEVIAAQYPTLPVISSETSIQKITFVQIQKFKLNETTYSSCPSS